MTLGLQYFSLGCALLTPLLRELIDGAVALLLLQLEFDVRRNVEHAPLQVVHVFLHLLLVRVIPLLEAVVDLDVAQIALDQTQ